MRPIILLLIISLNIFFVASMHHLKKINEKDRCTNHCENPVYLISRETGYTLDIYNDPSQTEVFLLYINSQFSHRKKKKFIAMFQ